MKPNEEESSHSSQISFGSLETSQPEASSMVHHALIQPISSEDDIRREAAISTPPPQPQKVIEPTGTISNETLSPSTADVVVPESRPPVIIPPLPGTTSSLQPPQKKKSWLKRLLLFIVIIAILTIAAAYYYVSTYTVTASDLVEEKIDSTAFLRPQQWKQNGDSYGDGRAADGKSSSLMLIRISPAEPQLIGASDDIYNLLRQQVQSQLTDEKVREMLQKSSKPCVSEARVERESSIASTEGMIEIHRMAMSCKREDGKFTLKLRVVLGKADGKLRIIGVGATGSLWEHNGDAYQKIIDSLKVVQ